VDTVGTPLVDLAAGTRPAELRRSTCYAYPGWSAAIKMVATDLAESGSERLKRPRLAADAARVARGDPRERGPQLERGPQRLVGQASDDCLYVSRVSSATYRVRPGASMLPDSTKARGAA
jgi:hypothetical protein